MDDDSKAKIQLEVKELPEQKEAGSAFSVMGEAFYITKPNLCLLFGGIAIIAQVYLGWDDFWDAWQWIGIESVSLSYEGYSAIVTPSDWHFDNPREYQRFVEIKKTAPLYLLLPFTLGFQIIVLVFIKHYSNRLRQFETRQAIKKPQ